MISRLRNNSLCSAKRGVAEDLEQQTCPGKRRGRTDNLSGHPVKRQDPVDPAQFDGFCRHSKDYAGFFGLSEIDSAGPVHLQHAFCSIVTPPARHDDADTIGARVSGGGG
jgi:hypothetical protein